MNISKLLSHLAVAVIAGGIGFHCGSRHAAQELAAALSAAEFPAEAPTPTPGWEVSDHKNQMTDKESVFLALESYGSNKATIQIECYPAELFSFYSDDFYSQSDDYYVTYRIDKRPAVTMERWSSITNFASPPDEGKFVSELSGGHELIIDVSTPSASTRRYTFDLSGYDKVRKEFNARCSKLPKAAPQQAAES